MRISPIVFCFLLVLVLGDCTQALAHEGHHHRSATVHHHGPSGVVELPAPENSFQADGKVYRWVHRPELGKQSEAMISAAKGGLHNNADWDRTTNEVVTVVARHGLVALDAELKEWKLVQEQDPSFAKGMNAHGTDCFEMDGQSYWAFASTNTDEVIVSQRGKIVSRLTRPAGKEFDNPTVNSYFSTQGKFKPCDVVYLPDAKRLVVVIGYAPGDFALSAELRDGQWQWGGAAWGGRENQGGLFSTGHGVEIATEGGKEIVEVASRAHGRIFAFTSNGAQIRMPGADKEYYLKLPAGSKPCNLAHHRSSLFLPLLDPLPDSHGMAPVLMMEDGKPSGSLSPATYDALPLMRHMHGFCPVERNGNLYGVALSWRNGGENREGKLNDGRIAIFEAVEQ